MAVDPGSTPGAAADGLRSGGWRRGGDRGGLLLRHLPNGARRRSRRPLPRSARSPASRGRTTSEVRVRMGMHTGDASFGTEGYVGLHVHRASRIASVGHGGQVLLSDTTRSLVREALPEGAELRDLGVHRLKDLELPERLWQLVVDDLESDFAPIGSLDAVPNNLPTPADDLPRTGARDRRDHGTAGRQPAPDAHRARRHGKDAPQPRGGGPLPGHLPAGRLLRRAGAHHRAGARAGHHRPGARPSRAWRAELDRSADRPHRRAAHAARPRQLRAGDRCGAIDQRPPGCLPEPRRPGQQPQHPPRLRRAGVSGSPARPPRSRPPAATHPALAVRGGRALHRASALREARFRRHQRQRTGGGRDLRAPRWAAAGHRAGGGAHPDLHARSRC